MTTFESFMGRDCLVPLVEMDDFTPEYRAWADESIKKTGRLANSAKAMAHATELAPIARTAFSTVASGGSLGPELTMLIRLVVSNLNACVYCSTHQTNTLIKMGVPENKIRNINAYKTDPAFSERERTALDFAAAVTRDSANIPDDLCDRLVAAFDPKQRVEITMVAAFMGMLNKFNDALRVPIETASVDLAETVAATFD
jgi:uncharacterized peroxidase-related enzyme